MNGRTFVLSLGYKSDKTFIECLKEELDKATYAHNKVRSRVVSARGEFVRLVSSVFREQTVYTSFAALVSALAFGNYHIESKVWNRFVVRLSEAIGYSDLPTDIEKKQAFAIVMGDYIESNPHLSVEMLDEQEALRVSLDAENAEKAPEKSETAKA